MCFLDLTGVAGIPGFAGGVIAAWVWGMGVDMKSRTRTVLRIHAICEYTILRYLTIMFSFLVAMFSFHAVFHVTGVFCG